MIARATGTLQLEDEVIDPAASVSLGARWRAIGGGVWVREATDLRGRSLLVTACVTAGRLLWVELCYAVRRPAEGVEGPLAWETARKDYQDAIVREWFANSVHELMYAPPPQPGAVRYTFAWGTVLSDLRSDARGARIEIRFLGDAD